MELTELINHPEQMDRETLYELRSLLALYPYFQTARLLMLQNLYLLHDPSFDEELRKAAIYITDRSVIFRLVEAAHYKLPTAQQPQPATESSPEEKDSRTISLIDNFLESLPKDDADEPKEKKPRKPTPADAAVDYVAYLLECEQEEEQQATTADSTPQLRGQQLIDSFIEQDRGKIVLSETPQYLPVLDEPAEQPAAGKGDGVFTETLARIYIKQGRYDKALEILQQISLNNPEKNIYFADQMRFLKKLIINNKNKFN